MEGKFGMHLQVLRGHSGLFLQFLLQTGLLISGHSIKFQKNLLHCSLISPVPLPLPPEIFGIKYSIVRARVCQVTGKVPMGGNKVSHSNIKTKRRFLPNLQKKRFYLIEEDKWITLKLSTDAIRTINKNGLYSVVKQLRANGEKI